ncbi:MAG: hypothetical protein CMG75_01425 [Candidatus Marinimicrobia bacterium]|nr:hypothetical protein [Candidatus Neomarinimicrobiota bacterium]
MRISTTDYFDLRLTLNSGQLFHWKEESPGIFIVIKNNTVLRIRQENNFEIRLNQYGNMVTKNEIIKLIGLNNQSTIQNILSKDPLVNSLIADYRGLTIMCQDPYECLISFISSSMSNIPRIMLNLKNLRKMGNSIIEGTSEYLFPSAQQIVSLGENKLRKIGFGYRAKYIIQTCKKIIQEKIDFQSWQNKSDEELKLDLMNFSGVGNKIAECVMLFGFERSRSFPIDVWMKRAIFALKPNLRELTNEELCIWGKSRWKENAGLVQQILYTAIRSGKIPN